MNKKQRQKLLGWARKALINKAAYQPDERVEDELKKPKGVFVTLTIKGELRGCIGNILPEKPLYKSVIENAVAAGYRDPRFPELTAEELKKVKIEISLLSKPKKVKYDSEDDLIHQILGNEGIILSLDHRKATFLPQVWKQLPDKHMFLDQLSLKAGLNPELWKQGKVDIQKYEVEKFQE